MTTILSRPKFPPPYFLRPSLDPTNHRASDLSGFLLSSQGTSVLSPAKQMPLKELGSGSGPRREVGRLFTTLLVAVAVANETVFASSTHCGRVAIYQNFSATAGWLGFCTDIANFPPGNPPSEKKIKNKKFRRADPRLFFLGSRCLEPLFLIFWTSLLN